MYKLKNTAVHCALLCLVLMSTSANIRLYGSSCVTPLPITDNIELLTTENMRRLTQITETSTADYQDLVLSPDDQLLIATTTEVAEVYDLTDMSIASPFWDTCHELEHVAFSSDGSHIATVGRDSSQIQVWDADSSELLQTIEGEKDEITSVAFSPSNTLLAWAGSNTDNLGGDPWIGEAGVFIHDLRTDEIVTSIEEVDDIVTQLRFTSNSEHIMFVTNIAGYSNFEMQLWEIATHTQISSQEAWFIISGYTGDGDVVAIGLAQSLGLTNEFSYQIEIWNPTLNISSQTISISAPIEPESSSVPNYMTALTLNGDASLVAMGDTNGQITIWNAANGTSLFSFQGYSDAVRQLLFSRDGRLLIGLGSEDGIATIRIWGVN